MLKKLRKNLHVKKNILLSQFKYLKYLFMNEPQKFGGKTCS